MTATPATNPNTTPEQGGMTWGEVMNLWVQAGGNPNAAAMAAAIADASSGLNPKATFSDANGQKYEGLFMVGQNQGPLFTTDPLASARAAIQLSNNGTDFSSWCSAWSDNDCGNSGGTYLGDGANALASLKLRGGYFQTVGGQPVISGEEQAAKQANAIYGQQKASGSPMSGRLILVVLIAAGLILFLVLKNRGKGKKVEPPKEP